MVLTSALVCFNRTYSEFGDGSHCASESGTSNQSHGHHGMEHIPANGPDAEVDRNADPEMDIETVDSEAETLIVPL